MTNIVDLDFLQTSLIELSTKCEELNIRILETRNYDYLYAKLQFNENSNISEFKNWYGEY